MLAIRMQRTGRRGHAHFRVVVQDSRQSPKSGKFVALLGSYDPHTKVVSLQKEKAQEFVKNGAQPSERVVGILKAEGVKLPKWVAKTTKKKKVTKNSEKLRKNRPAEAKPVAAEAKDEPKEPEAPKEQAEETTPDKPAEAEPATEPASEQAPENS